MDVVNVGVSTHELKPMTWDCNSFWEKIEKYNLHEQLDMYLCEYFNGQATIGEINDLLRYEGNEILKFLGVPSEEIDE